MQATYTPTHGPGIGSSAIGICSILITLYGVGNIFSGLCPNRCTLWWVASLTYEAQFDLCSLVLRPLHQFELLYCNALLLMVQSCIGDSHSGSHDDKCRYLVLPKSVNLPSLSLAFSIHPSLSPSVLSLSLSLSPSVFFLYYFVLQFGFWGLFILCSLFGHCPDALSVCAALTQVSRFWGLLVFRINI